MKQVLQSAVAATLLHALLRQVAGADLQPQRLIRSAAQYRVAVGSSGATSSSVGILAVDSASDVQAPTGAAQPAPTVQSVPATQQPGAAPPVATAAAPQPSAPLAAAQPAPVGATALPGAPAAGAGAALATPPGTVAAAPQPGALPVTSLPAAAGLATTTAAPVAGAGWGTTFFLVLIVLILISAGFIGVYLYGKQPPKPLQSRLEEVLPRDAPSTQAWKPAKARHQVKKSVLLAEASRGSSASEDDAPMRDSRRSHVGGRGGSQGSGSTPVG